LSDSFLIFFKFLCVLYSYYYLPESNADFIAYREELFA